MPSTVSPRIPSALPALARTLILAAIGLASARAENWPQWRGPAFNGSTADAGLPTTFSMTEKVRWKAPMPGPSAATPVVWGDRIFVSSTDSEKQVLLALCLDARTGKELWRKQTAEGIRRDERSNFASPSPVTDGRHVWFFYGTGDLVGFTVAGEQIWARNIQKDHGTFAFQWTFSSTPLLSNGRLYLQVLQRDVPVQGRGRTDGPNDSYLLALDPITGKDLWKVVRPSEAVQESREAFSTPVPFTHNGRSEILLSGGDCLTGHDPVNGKELWRWGTWNTNRIGHWRLVPSPAAGGGVVLGCGPKGAPIFAVKAGLTGTLANSDLAWASQDRELSSDVGTPLFYQGRFYVLNGGRKTLSCVDPASGKIHWTGSLASRSVFETSPTGADGKIYFMNHNGDVYVVAAGDEFKLLHTTPMGDDTDRSLRSSIVAANKQLLIRTGSHLYAIAE